MSGHTPGPWLVGEEADDGTIDIVSDARPYVCEVIPGAVDKWTRSNALLIAAAPDLLEALKGMIVSYELEASPLNPALLKARAALAKATGGAE